MPRPRTAFLGLALLVGAGAGCTSILGDFASGGGSGGGRDASLDAQGSSGGSTDSGSDHSSPPEAGPDAGEDAAVEGGLPPPPPPPPGKPGFDLTSGGNVSKSTHYKLVGAVGEAPGGYVVGHSINYTLKGGVVAETVTQ